MTRNLNSHADPRVFLGFNQPPLVGATEWLVAQYRDGDRLDLADHLLVLPTTRASMRLLQLLVRAAEKEQLMLTPPTITTIGRFPEYLYVAEKHFASDLTQQIAWAKALLQTPPWELNQLIAKPETKKTLDDWQPLAKLISELHRRLANDVWSFRSVVREVKKLKKDFHEIKRWEALEAIQGRYYELLTDVELWDMQAARNVAIRRKLCRTDKKIVLIGAADLNRATREILAQVRPAVSVLVAAPLKMADKFDEFGSLITSRWLDIEVKIPDEHLMIVDQADDQAFAAAHYITNLNEAFSADQITIGVPDPSVVPQIERSLNAIGLKHRDLKGRPLRDAAPVRLMVAIKEYLDGQDYDSFATMVRHPDMFHWLVAQTSQSGWLDYLDHYQRESLPSKIAIDDVMPFGDAEDIRRQLGEVSEHADMKIQRIKILNLVHSRVAKLLKPLSGKPKSIARWTEPWSKVLLSIYGSRAMNKNDLSDRRTIQACREIYEALGDKQQVPDQWQTRASASRALKIALEAASEGTVVPPPIPDAVELAGWLDLPLDDAPVMVVTGMNDEHVPASENGHLFLPNSLCEDLGILDNNRRFARDAYALTVIHSVRKHILLIAGRRDLVGEPKKPSRLLFADDDMTLARRAKAFFGYKGNVNSRFWLADHEQALPQQHFKVPPPRCFAAPNQLSVTGFREFIKCPYRFYLSKLLRLENVEDNLRELDGGAFGTLAHDVLEDFGRSELKESTDALAIGEFLNDQLTMRARLTYGGSRLPAVRIQVQQLRLRLDRFAPLQADKARDGWQIVSVEDFYVHEFDVDGQPFLLRGTIDRVDVHQKTGQVAVWDYKTSDKGEPPYNVHYSKNGWKDLQLPLYRHLAKEIKVLNDYDLSNMQLGFILLPRQLDKIGFETAHWSPDQLREADQKAIAIIRQIRRGIFWPPAEQPPQYSQALAAICQDNVFEQNSDARSESGEFTSEVAQ